MVHLNQQAGFGPWYNLYVIKVDRENQNCYNYRGFGHLARNYRNRGTEGRIGERRRLEYRNGNNRQRRIIEENGQNSNLNKDGDLITLN